MWQEFNKFLKTKTNLSVNSVKHYTTDVRVCEEAYGRVTGETGEDYICSAVAKATKYRRYHSIKRYLAWAVKAKKLKPEDIIMTMEAPSKPERESRALEDKDHAQLLETIIHSPHLSEQDKTFFLVLAATGRRADEILTIRAEDVVLHDKVMQLFICPKGSETRSQETWVYQEDHEAFKSLLRLLELAPQKLFEYPGEDPYHVVYYLWNKYVSQKHTMHQLRHTAITKVANDPNGGILIAQAMAGHKCIETTRGYVTLYTKTYHNAMQKIKKA